MVLFLAVSDCNANHVRLVISGPLYAAVLVDSDAVLLLRLVGLENVVNVAISSHARDAPKRERNRAYVRCRSRQWLSTHFTIAAAIVSVLEHIRVKR
jgi:hypothetical protein